MKQVIMLLSIAILILTYKIIDKPLWKVTSYCSCSICTGKYSDGVTASGKKVKYGMVANNWLPFGTKVSIRGLGVFKIEDRGSEKYFGTKQERRKAIDIYLPSHKEAKEFGVKYLNVEVLK